MKMEIAKACKPVVLTLCMSPWAFAGNAHAASSHVYPAAGCQETYPDHAVRLDRGEGFIHSINAIWVTCPIVTSANSTHITVAVMYEAVLVASATFSGKPDLFTCELSGDNSFDTKTVNLNIRNNQTLEGSLKLSMAASPRFNVLACYLLGSQGGFNFNMYGYQVDES